MRGGGAAPVAHHTVQRALLEIHGMEARAGTGGSEAEEFVPSEGGNASEAYACARGGDKRQRQYRIRI